MLSHSVVSDWDLNLARTYGAWFQDLMKLRFLMSHCKKKFSERLYFGGAPKSLQMMTAAMKLKDAYSLEEKLTKLDSIVKSKDITLPKKVHLVKL